MLHRAFLENRGVQNGWVPLFKACKFGDIAAIKILLENHANPNVVDRNGETPLHRIGCYESRTTLQIIQLLLKHKANIEAIDEEGRTPFFEACNSENIVAVKVLLRYEKIQEIL